MGGKGEIPAGKAAKSSSVLPKALLAAAAMLQCSLAQSLGEELRLDLCRGGSSLPALLGDQKKLIFPFPTLLTCCLTHAGRALAGAFAMDSGFGGRDLSGECSEETWGGG